MAIRTVLTWAVLGIVLSPGPPPAQLGEPFDRLAALRVFEDKIEGYATVW